MTELSNQIEASTICKMMIPIVDKMTYCQPQLNSYYATGNLTQDPKAKSLIANLTQDEAPRTLTMQAETRPIFSLYRSRLEIDRQRISHLKIHLLHLRRSNLICYLRAHTGELGQVQPGT